MLVGGVSRWRIAGVASSTISSGIFSIVEPEAVGNGGDLAVTARSLSLLDGGQISASTFGQGNSGDVKVTVEDDLLVDGVGIYPVFYGLLNDRNPSNISNAVQEFAIGDSGDITVETGNLLLRNGGRITSGTLSEGDAGLINIEVEASFIADGASNDGLVSGVYSNVGSGAIGTGNNINIQTNQITLTDGGQIVTETSGQGNAGNVKVVSDSSVLLSGVNAISGLASRIFTGTNASGLDIPVRGGDISLETNRLRIEDGAVLDTRTIAEGPGGDVILAANIIELIQGGQVRTTTFGSGNAGDIIIREANNILISGSYTSSNQPLSESILLAEP